MRDEIVDSADRGGNHDALPNPLCCWAHESKEEQNDKKAVGKARRNFTGEASLTSKGGHMGPDEPTGLFFVSRSRRWIMMPTSRLRKYY